MSFTIITHPFIFLGFIVLHFIGGEIFTGYIYWYRFKKMPVIYYKFDGNNTHNIVSRWLAIPVIIWFASVGCYAFSPEFRQSFLGWNWLNINPFFGWLFGFVGLIGMLICQYQMGESFRIGQETVLGKSQQKIC